MNMIGMKTTASEMVIERTVKPISRDPFKEASSALSPVSIRRMMFSTTTMASSTTNPIERVMAMRERVFRVKPKAFITAKVPISESGTTRLGMIVVFSERRKRKMTAMTRKIVRTMVICTSVIDSRMNSDWS